MLESPRIVVAGGIRVLLGPKHPQPPNSVVLVSFQDGKLYVNDVARGTQAPDPQARGGGTQIGPIYRQDVISSSGNHRLRLVDVARAWGFDFHSLTFEKMNEGAWESEICFTQEPFQGKHKYRRWISGLRSVQDDSGKVVIKVGECSHPIDPPGSSAVLYSWRLWDLRDNVEARRLKDCEDPFEPLE